MIQASDIRTREETDGRGTEYISTIQLDVSVLVDNHQPQEVHDLAINETKRRLAMLIYGEIRKQAEKARHELLMECFSSQSVLRLNEIFEPLVNAGRHLYDSRKK